MAGPALGELCCALPFLWLRLSISLAASICVAYLFLSFRPSSIQSVPLWVWVSVTLFDVCIFCCRLVGFPVFTLLLLLFFLFLPQYPVFDSFVWNLVNGFLCEGLCLWMLKARWVSLLSGVADIERTFRAPGLKVSARGSFGYSEDGPHWRGGRRKKTCGLRCKSRIQLFGWPGQWAS